MSCNRPTGSAAAILGHAPSLHSPAGAKAATWFREQLMVARRLYRVWRERRELLALDDRMLADIGISRCEALTEGCKPFWT